jgi:hypothetical protein
VLAGLAGNKARSAPQCAVGRDRRTAERRHRVLDRGDVKVGDGPSIRYLLIELLSRSYIAEKIDARTNFFIFNFLYKRIFLLYIQ